MSGTLRRTRGAAPRDLNLAQLSLGELSLIWAVRTRLARGPSGLVAGFRLAFGLAGVDAAVLEASLRTPEVSPPL